MIKWQWGSRLGLVTSLASNLEQARLAQSQSLSPFFGQLGRAVYGSTSFKQRSCDACSW
jgi:hypothetical protein